MRINYEILNVLFHAEARSKLVAATQKMIEEGLAEVGIKHSYKFIYNHLKELIELGHIKYGMNQSNARTYYITSKGIEWMNEMEKEE